MTGLSAPARLRLPPLDVTLRKMRRAAIDGSRSVVVSTWTGDAAHEAAGRDAVAMLGVLSRRLRDRVAYANDVYGRQDVQTIEETLERKAGACDDTTVAMLALGMGAGIRGRIAVLFTPEDDGRLYPTHVLPLFEVEPGRFLPVETTRDVPLGEWPDAPAGSEWEFHDVTGTLLHLPIGDLFGAIGSVVGGVLGLGAASSDAKAKKSIAKAEVQGKKVEADALRYVADQETYRFKQELAARERAQRAEIQARDTEALRSVQARERVLTTFERALPTLGLAAGALALAKIVPAIIGGARSRRRAA